MAGRLAVVVGCLSRVLVALLAFLLVVARQAPERLTWGQASTSARWRSRLDMGTKLAVR